MVARSTIGAGGRAFFTAGCLLALALMPGPARAQDMSVQVPLQYSIFMKVLAFDRNLAADESSTLVVGIAFQSGFRNSLLAKEDFHKAMGQNRDKILDGWTVLPVAIDLDQGPDLREILVKSRVKVLYVAPLRAYDLARIVDLARECRIITLTGVAEYVAKGIAIGVDVNNDRPEILVNLAASRAGGADLSASLLKLARVFR